ncbi:small integral membrane protein 24 isoform X1, partial [Clarias magur]
MPSPEVQYKEIHNGSTPPHVPRHLLQEAVSQDERYFSSYIPPARDAIIILPKHVLYILIGVVMIIVGTYGITGHLIKDLVHDLA